MKIEGKNCEWLLYAFVVGKVKAAYVVKEDKIEVELLERALKESSDIVAEFKKNGTVDTDNYP